VLDKNDGTLLGILPGQGPVAGSPVFLDGQVIFADMAGYVWSYPEPRGRFGPKPAATWSRYVSAPVLSAPEMVIPPEEEAKNWLVVTNVDDQVYALNAGGELLWRYAHRLDIGRTSKLSLYAAPRALSHQTPEGLEIITGFSDGVLVGLSGESGELKWSLPVGEGSWPDIVAPVVLAPGNPGDSIGDTLLVGGFSGPLLALDAGTRAIRWRVDAPAASPPLVVGDVIWHGGADGVLRKISRITGEVGATWKADIPGLSVVIQGIEALTTGQAQEKNTSGTLGTPILTDSGLLVNNSDGSLYLLDSETAVQKWELAPGFLMNGILGSPAVQGGSIYLLSNAGTLYALSSIEEQPAYKPDPWISPFGGYNVDRGRP
jgi:outer membrane protein assembly factor BamB